MIKIFKRVLALSLLLTLIIIRPAAAAGKPAAVNLLGNDVSYPQCGNRLPTDHAFGVVGLNGGKATALNACFGSQLAWAHRATGKTSQPKAQIYVNTANPGEVRDQVTTWPNSTTDQNPYGVDCVPSQENANYGDNNLACSWQYGWNRAVDDVDKFFIPEATKAGQIASPAVYTWWLDVETMNTWQSGSEAALARNVASLEGMVAAFKSRGIQTVGIYSTNYQWNVIVGNQVKSDSNLNYTKNWLAGAASEKDAKIFCNRSPLTLGSRVTLTQFVSRNLDYDYSCQG